MLHYLCIDPGPILSGYVVIADDKITRFGKEPNRKIIDDIMSYCNRLIIEIPDYSMSNGMSIIHTAIEIGKFLEAGKSKMPLQFGRVEMKAYFKVKNDSQVRKLIISTGIKAKLTKDSWQAYLLWMYYKVQVK